MSATGAYVMAWRSWAVVLAASALVVGCQHRVEVASPEPITINLNVKLELSEDIVALLREEKEAAEMPTRGVRPQRTAQVDELKAERVVGETFEGYLAVVDPDAAGPETEALLRAVNERRATDYQRIAAVRDQPVAAVEAVAGEVRIEEEPSGRLVMPRPGVFVPKP